MVREERRKGDEYILLTMVLFTRWRPLSLEPQARRGAEGIGEWGEAAEARERDCHNLATLSCRRWGVPTKRFSSALWNLIGPGWHSRLCCGSTDILYSILVLALFGLEVLFPCYCKYFFNNFPFLWIYCTVLAFSTFLWQNLLSRDTRCFKLLFINSKECSKVSYRQ